MLDLVGTTPIAGIAYRKIDHMAIAVRDLESAVSLFVNVLGFEVQRRLRVEGKRTGMVSAELVHNDIKIVLCEGTEPDSQVTRLIEHYGPGVAHIALEVDDVDATVALIQARGLTFDTQVIRGPGLTQAFSSRDPNTGMSFEFISRHGEQGFLEQNVKALFDQLEQSGAY